MTGVNQEQDVKRILDAFSNIFEKVSEDNRDKQQLLSQLDKFRQDISGNPNDMNRVYNFINTFESTKQTTTTSTGYPSYLSSAAYPGSLPQQLSHLSQPDLTQHFGKSNISPEIHLSSTSEKKQYTKTEQFDSFLSYRQISRTKELESLSRLFPYVRVFYYERNNFWQNVMLKFFSGIINNENRNQ